MSTDPRRLERQLRRHFYAGIKRYALIEKGDSILLGLSGGKDSLALLDLLGEAMKRSGRQFDVKALHVRVAGVDYQSDADYLTAKAKAAGVEIYFEEISFEPDRNERRSPCFLCAWHRRKALFDLAQRLGCNKIALGHHQDDILRTALMNLAHQGAFATMPARLTMRKFPITIIRPLCMVSEATLKAHAEIEGYQPLVKLCPHEKESDRTRIETVAEAFKSLNPDFRHSLWHALDSAGKLTEG